MRVLVVAQYYPPDLGGSATRAYNVAKGMAGAGVDVTVLTAFPHYPSGHIPDEYRGKLYTVEHKDGVKIVRGFILPLESKGLLYRVLLFACFDFFSVLGLLFARGVDVVWVANPDIFGLVPAVLLKALAGVPVAFNVDDLSMEDVENLKIMRRDSLLFRAARFVTRFLYGRADAFTPISPGYAPFIMQYGTPRDRVFLIRGGVDLSLFGEPKEPPAGGRFTATYSGSFSVAYDFDQVLEAASLLAVSDPDVRFVLQGKGELAPRIRAGVRKRGLRNVELVDRFYPREELRGVLGAADVLLLPLKDFGVPYPGISSKLYEYQAAARPILCVTEGASADYVRETGSGVVVKPGDARGIADAVRHLKAHPEERRRMGSSGRRYVEDHATIQKVGGQMAQLLERLASFRC